MSSANLNPTYDLEYYCLTDENYLLVKRDKSVFQIHPSEFQDGDLLPTQGINQETVWVQATRTTHTVPVGEQLVFLSTQAGAFNLTPGHKLFLDSGQLVAAGNLKRGEKLRNFNQLILPENSNLNPAAAYCLGAYAAEGSSQEGLGADGHGKWRLVWGLHHDEIIFATKILIGFKALCPDIEAQIDVYPEYTRRTVSAFSKHAVLKFRELGALGLAPCKRIPSVIWNGSREAKFAFIAGLFEGDSSWLRGRLVLSLTSRALAEGAYQLLNSLGISATLTTFQPRVHSRMYNVGIFTKDDLAVLMNSLRTWLYGWKHLQSILEYARSENGCVTYTKQEVETALKKCWPVSCAKFSKITGICQGVVRRLYGSWSRCLQVYNLIPSKMGRWGSNYLPQHLKNVPIVVPKKPKVLRTDFYQADVVTTVYDFTVPTYENFLMGGIVSHNSAEASQIYIGDVFVDEITSISYTLRQSKTPIYGYASQLFDTTSRGQVIVQGQFTINFKEQGYLWAILCRWFNQAAGPGRIANSLIAGKLNADPDGRGGAPIRGSNGTLMSRAGIERLTSGDATRAERYQAYNSLAGYSTFSGGARDKTFEDIMEAFEDHIWSNKTNDELLQMTRRADDNHFDGFDIFCTFGNYANKFANHTVCKIIGVRLLGFGKVVALGQNPVQESYEFLARAVV